MWENGKQWTVETSDGTKTLDEVADHESYKHCITEVVHTLSLDRRCESCTFPGGGGNKTTEQTEDGKTREVNQPFPPGETIECGRSYPERSKCEAMKLTIDQMLHSQQLCNPIRCHVCAPRGGARIKWGQTIAFRGLVSRFSQPHGMHITQPHKYIGRYLCRDPIGVCFELIDVEKGPTGRRMWLTESGYFCEDLNAEDRAQLEAGERKAPDGTKFVGSGIELADEHHPLLNPKPE